MRRNGPLFRLRHRAFKPAPEVQNAHEKMLRGSYLDAAIAFENLAIEAESEQRPRVAFLYLQAGRARILINDLTRGMNHLKKGLGVLADHKRYGQMYQAGQRIIQELKSRSLTAQADEIAQLLQLSMPGDPSARSGPTTRPTLPTHCPSCGGPMRLDELEWLDENSAECPYCGSPVQA